MTLSRARRLGTSIVPYSLLSAVVLCAVVLLVTAAPADAKSTPQDAPDLIRSVIKRQSDAWNAGSIDGFMAHYWKSPDLTFSSGGQTTRGWQATIDRYKRRYDTPEKMGKLAFTDLEVNMLGDDAALVLGRWRLERGDPISGAFSLVFRRIEGAWVIIHDHTSSDEEGEEGSAD